MEGPSRASWSLRVELSCGWVDTRQESSSFGSLPKAPALPALYLRRPAFYFWLHTFDGMSPSLERFIVVTARYAWQSNDWALLPEAGSNGKHESQDAGYNAGNSPVKGNDMDFDRNAYKRISLE